MAGLKSSSWEQLLQPFSRHVHDLRTGQRQLADARGGAVQQAPDESLLVKEIRHLAGSKATATHQVLQHFVTLLMRRGGTLVLYCLHSGLQMPVSSRKTLLRGLLQLVAICLCGFWEQRCK